MQDNFSFVFVNVIEEGREGRTQRGEGRGGMGVPAVSQKDGMVINTS